MASAVEESKEQQVQRTVAAFTREFQELAEKYDMYVVRVTLYDYHETSVADDSYLVVGRERADQLHLHDVVQESRLIDLS